MNTVVTDRQPAGRRPRRRRPNQPTVRALRIASAGCSGLAAFMAHMGPSTHAAVSAAVGIGLILSVIGFLDGQAVGSVGFALIGIGGMLTQLRSRGAPWLAVVVVALALVGSELSALATRLTIVVPYDTDAVRRRVNETIGVCGAGALLGLTVVLLEGVAMPASSVVTVLGGLGLVVLVGALGWGPTLAAQVRRRPPHKATAARKQVSDSAITSGTMNDETAAR